MVPLFLILLPIQCSKLWLCFEAFFMYESSRSDHLVSLRLRLCVCVCKLEAGSKCLRLLASSCQIELGTVSCRVLPLEAQHNLLCQFKYHKYARRHAQIFEKRRETVRLTVSYGSFQSDTYTVEFNRGCRIVKVQNDHLLALRWWCHPIIFPKSRCR